MPAEVKVPSTEKQLHLAFGLTASGLACLALAVLIILDRARKQRDVT
jgi:hypothetical protein